MNRQSESKSDSCDEPLFVLKYRRGKLDKRLVLFFAVILWLGYCALHRDWFPRVIGLLCLAYYVPLFLDYLFFKEVRLYKDRIVKIWNFVDKRQIKLADAQLKQFTGPTYGFKVGPGIRLRRVRSKRVNAVWAFFTGFSYNEILADPDDVKKLNALLAGLTGKKVEEFGQERVWIDLIKQEKK